MRLYDSKMFDGCCNRERQTCCEARTQSHWASITDEVARLPEKTKMEVNIK